KFEPRLQDLRGRVLDKATQVLDAAARAMTGLRQEVGWPAKDETLYWHSLAKADQRLGELYYLSNRIQDAMKRFRQADAIAERLAVAAPDDIYAQTQFAKSRRRLGVIALRKLGETEGGQRYLRQALQIHRTCLAKRPGDDELKNELVHSLGQFAASEYQ